MATITNTFWLIDGLGGDKSAGIVTQTETATIEFDEVVDNVEDAIADSGFREGQPHRNKPSLSLNDNITADVNPESNGTVWDFSLTYTNDPFGGSNTTEEDEFYIPKVAFGKWSYQIVVDRDKVSGDALENSAGDPIDPLPVESISAPILVITVKENGPNLGRIADIGSINSSQVKIAGVTIPKYCGQLDDYQPEPFDEGDDVISFKNTYTFKLKFFKNVDGDRIGFKLETLNAGFNFLDPDNSNAKTEITVADKDDEQVPVATPQLLASDGAKSTTPTYKEWVVNDVVNFSQYGLPSSYPVS